MGGRRDRDIERELEDHLRRETEANQASGMGTRAARRKAVLDLGSAERWREEGREAKGGTAFESWRRDLRLAARGLRRTPVFALAAILTLALGIGANTAMFSVIEAVLLQPLPFTQPQKLVELWEAMVRQPGQRIPFSYPDFQDVRRARSLAAAAAYSVGDMPLTGLGEAQHVRVAEASDTLFGVLGVTPALGRGFRPGEDRPGALGGVDAAVLSDRLARKEFGNPTAALQKRLVLNGHPYQVVGVMAPGFQFPLDDHEDLWLTMAPRQVSTDGPPIT
ncbi:MAG: ABC transporter permease, partial [Terriglobales bacterium]